MDLEKIKAGLTGCGSHSCFIKPPVGMGTNGQCTCLDDKTKMQRYIFITNHEITSLREQLEIAKKDGERLDYLDSLNDKLNQHYKTNYGFKLHCSHNVIRIFSQSVNHIDLNDANSGIDKYTKVREAIDNVMKV